MSETATRQLTFQGGTRTLLGFLVAVAAALALWVPIGRAVADMADWLVLLENVGMFALLAAITVVILRIEGVRPVELGLSRRHLLGALAAFGGIWISLNAIGVAIATATGDPWGVSHLWKPVDPVVEELAFPWIATVFLQFFVVGFVEEFAIRGYLQTKLVALLGDDSRLRIALGIVSASVVFGLLHIPGSIIAGSGPGGIAFAVGITAATAVVFGVFYELTHNLYFVALLHGLGNTWFLLVDAWNLSGNAPFIFMAGVGVVYIGTTLLYRRWTMDSDLTPLRERIDATALTA